MNELVDKAAHVRMPAGNGRSFIFPKVSTVHDMRQKHPAIPSTVRFILPLKDIPHHPSHRPFKSRHSQIPYQP
ncbi:MAG: hypothetical protein SOY69_00060, partial [Alloprevotella sp.]|nr:hypothetical protein [Alloprevotella sp.]